MNEQEIRIFQGQNFDYYGKDLEVDGKYGPKTQWAYSFSQNPEYRRSVVAAALGYVGYREEPYASNRGPFVDRIIEPANIGYGHPWCCAYVSWVLRGCQRNVFPKYHVSVAEMWDTNLDREVQNPRLGDVFVIVRPDGTGHTGFVIGVDVNEIMTVEGNVQHMVKVGRRDRSKITGYLTIQDYWDCPNPGVANVQDLDGAEDR